MELALLAHDNLDFPALDQALVDPNGLLAVGGDLSAERLEQAYRHGCFPWFNPGEPILWWSPNPRMVLFPERLHVSHSLNKLLRKQLFKVTFDKDFAAVIYACSEPRAYADGTWITTDMQQAYITLHKRGLAHSVEVWQQEQLVGGLYGIAIGQLFFGESMFSKVSNASKYGFFYLVEKLKQAGVVLIDCQMHTSHLQSLGAELITRQSFVKYLQDYQNKPIAIAWQS